MKKHKFNIIDACVIVGILVLVLLVWKRQTIKNTVTRGNTKAIRFICVVEDENSNVLEHLKVGDRLFAEYRFQEAEIKDIQVEKQKTAQPDAEGKLQVLESPEKFSARVEVEAQVRYDGPYMQLGGQEVKAGIPYILKTETFAVNSEIVFVEVLQ